jgi:hypothetical protein
LPPPPLSRVIFSPGLMPLGMHHIPTIPLVLLTIPAFPLNGLLKCSRSISPLASPNTSHVAFPVLPLNHSVCALKHSPLSISPSPLAPSPFNDPSSPLALAPIFLAPVLPL